MQPRNVGASRAPVFEAMVTVVDAVTRDLAALAKRAPELAESAEAATALALARELDDNNSATSKSMCARALTETMAALRAMAPPVETTDALDQLAAARSKRRAKKTA